MNCMEARVAKRSDRGLWRILVILGGAWALGACATAPESGNGSSLAKAPRGLTERVAGRAWVLQGQDLASQEEILLKNMILPRALGFWVGVEFSVDGDKVGWKLLDQALPGRWNVSSGDETGWGGRRLVSWTTVVDRPVWTGSQVKPLRVEVGLDALLGAMDPSRLNLSELGFLVIPELARKSGLQGGFLRLDDLDVVGNRVRARGTVRPLL